MRKAAAFRGRSEQDRSALCPACCATILETFRRNVFNRICVDTKTNFCFVKLADTARRVPAKADNTKHRAETKRFQNRCPEKAAPAERSWREVLRRRGASCVAVRRQRNSLRHASGARRRWVRKAAAFRGRSEQDRSALCPACCATILETFRRNVFNGICVDTKTNFCFVEIGRHGTPCPYRMCCKTAPLFLEEAKDTAQPFL